MDNYNQNKKGFIIGRIHSVKYVFSGIWKLITTEHSIITQLILILILTFLGFYKNISSTEWMIQIMCFGIILATESMNTAIEKIVDFIHPEYHKKIGFIKDIAAGAVGFVAIASFIILSIIYIPKFTH